MRAGGVERFRSVTGTTLTVGLLVYAGFSAGEAAARIGMGRAQLSQIETAKTTILTERLHELCRLYGCMDKTYIEALVVMSEATGKGWWTPYKKPMEQGPLNMAELWKPARLKCGCTSHSSSRASSRRPTTHRPSSPRRNWVSRTRTSGTH
ncbi:helix-turn-helix domain-containing protein [Streptomyces sp. GLT-R25]